MTVPFAEVTDPLSAGTAVICTDSGGLNGSELSMTDIQDATGGFLQGNARMATRTGTVRYYPGGAVTWPGNGLTCAVGGATVFVTGSTMQGFFLVSVKPGTDDNTSHQTIDVQARTHVNGDFVDTNGQS